jgi:glycosyltransferase involved in cell wall biosynthesis
MYGVVSTTLGHLVPGSTREAAQQLLLMGGLGALVYVAVLFGLWVATARPEGPETTLVRVIGRAIRARSADRVSAERLQVSPMDMGERPLVSVVIPAYNSAAYLQPALASVASQTYSPLEIILVDDGSTDGTVDVARRCGADVRIFTQPNRGAGAARNLGLEQARGQYIAFLDSDDLWHPRKIEFQMAHLLGCGGCVGVYCDKLELRGRSAEPDWAQARYLYDTVYMARDDATSGWLYLELLRDSIVHTSTLLVSREVLERTGRFDESLRKGQDLDYWLRLSRAGPIHRLAAVLSAYRIHPGSVSHRLMSTNFHAQVVERALRRFGVADPAGRTLARNEASSILALSWFEFAYHHFKHGSLSVCRESARRAIEYQPTMLRAWRLSLRARARSLLKSGAAQTTVRG